MKAKMKIGHEKEKVDEKTNIIAKYGGILPILPLLGVFGSLVSGATGVPKIINDNKAATSIGRTETSLEGHGVYLASYKRR